MLSARRSLFGPRRRLGSYESSKGRKLSGAIRRDSRSRRLHLEPLEDRTLLSVGVGGMVWDDLNLDGIRDLDEPGVAGAVAEVFSSTDAVIGNEDDVSLGVAITDADGLYSFDDLPDSPNFYAVFRTPVGYEFTAQDAGGDDALDSDVDATGATDLFAVAAGQTDTTIDAGLIGDSPEFGWALNAGVTDENSSAEAVVVDDSGNVYVTGYFSGTVDFDSGSGVFNLTSAGEGDVFVAKYSADGALVWAKSMGGEGTDKGLDIALADDGSLLVTGYFYDTADFDPSDETFALTSAGMNDAFTLKLDADGNLVWAVRMGGEGAELARSIALGPDGSVYTTGYSMDAEEADILLGEPNTDVFVSKLDSDGNSVWVKTVGDDDSDEGAGIAVADDGCVYVTGYFSGTVDFDPGEDVHNITVGEGDDNRQDSFVLKLDADGNFVWATGLDGNDIDVMNDVAVASDGNVYVTGSSSAELAWINFPFPVVFFPIQSHPLWGGPNGGCIISGSISSDYPFLFSSGLNLFTVSNDLEVNTVVQGSAFSLFGITTEASSIDLGDVSGILVVKLDSSGNLVWSESFGSMGSEGVGIAIGSDDNIYATGTLVGDAVFGSDSASFTLDGGDGSAFVSVLNPAGKLVRAYLAGSPDDVAVRAYLAGSSDDVAGLDIAVSADGTVYVCGIFSNTVDFDPGTDEFNLENIGNADFFVCKFLAFDGPTDLSLTENSVGDGQAAGTLVGILSSLGEQSGATYTYSLVEGDGDGDNDSFVIVGDQLQTNAVFDAAEKSSYTIRVRSTDHTGQYAEKEFVVTVADVTAPDVALTAPALVNSHTPEVTVSAMDGEVSLPDDSTVLLDVDLNNDGDFDDDDESGYTTATLVEGTATFNVSPELADGTYRLQARASDAADNEGVSNVAAMVVDTTAPTISIGEPSDTRTVLDPITFTVTYDDPNFDASTLAAADVTLHATGTADGTVTVDDGTGNTRIVTISDCSGNGTLSISIAAGTASDLAGNLTPAAGQSTTFIVKPSAHTISNVVVAEAVPDYGSFQNRLLESNEILSISWTVRDELGYIAVIGVTPQIPKQTLWIDAQQVAVNSLSLNGSKFVAKFGPIEVGTHSYTIHSRNDYGLQAICSGTFEVIEAIIGGPMISNVVVAEAGTAKNGTLESSDNLLITWSATRFNGIASKSLTVDGQAVSTIYGPYGDNYAGVFGSLAAGQHAFMIEATDFNGVRSEYYGTFDVAATTAAAPVISLVVVAEAGAGGNRDGTLDSSDQLVITWSATSDDGIASKSLTVDGQAVSTIYGPYGVNYAGVFGPLAAGTHAYTIEVTDTNGIASIHNGTFNVIAAAADPPQIGNVVVAETAISSRDGLLNTEETLVLTWTLTDADGIASKSLSVDGMSVATIYGPYGNAYAGLLFRLAAGTHSYTIQATDATGQTSTLNGTFHVYSALTLDVSTAPTGLADAVTDAELASIAAEAAHRLEAVLGSRVSTALSGVSIQVANLPGNLLGATTDGKILIDRDAAGHGWFVDPTPGDDEEFILDDLGSLVARQNTTADGRADLLTTVMHELGHVLGYNHADEGLMDDLLPLGARRTAATDKVFAGYGQ